MTNDLGSIVNPDSRFVISAYVEDVPGTNYTYRYEWNVLTNNLDFSSVYQLDRQNSSTIVVAGCGTQRMTNCASIGSGTTLMFQINVIEM